MGYVEIKELWYAIKKTFVLDESLQLLGDDHGAIHIVSILPDDLVRFTCL